MALPSTSKSWLVTSRCDGNEFGERAFLRSSSRSELWRTLRDHEAAESDVTRSHNENLRSDPPSSLTWELLSSKNHRDQSRICCFPPKVMKKYLGQPMWPNPSAVSPCRSMSQEGHTITVTQHSVTVSVSQSQNFQLLPLLTLPWQLPLVVTGSVRSVEKSASLVVDSPSTLQLINDTPASGVFVATVRNFTTRSWMVCPAHRSRSS